MSEKRVRRAAQGSGTIRQRPDGRWEARYTVGRDPGTGKQIQRSIYGATQKDVRLKLQQATIDINHGVYSDPTQLTVGQWLDLWHSDFLGSIKPSTVTAYKQHIRNHLKPAFNVIKLTSLKPAQIQKFYNELQRSGLSPKTIKNIHGVFHKSLSQAVLLGYIRVNPSTVCKLPRIEKAEINPLDSAELTSFLKAINGHRLESLYTVALFTGMRLGEILGLTWDRIDFQQGTILIDRQLLRPREKGDNFVFGPLKNDKPRKITPAPFIMETLQAHRVKQLQEKLRAGSLWVDGPGYVFTGELGGHASYWTLITHLKSILQSLGIAPRRFHDLRHTYAVAALRSGDDVKTVQVNLGHHTAAFTLDIYGHVTSEMRKDSAARMEAFIDSVKHA